VSELLIRLSRLNPTTVFLGALVLVVLGLFVPGVVGGLLLMVLALVVGALVVGTWERRPATRPLRLGVFLLLLVVALTKII
jgi:energy-coupling factor transporter transmembrane protein EcfT